MRLGKERAYVKIYKNGDGYIHCNTIIDNLRMIEVIFLHLEHNGYDLENVREVLDDAMTRHRRPHNGK